MKLSSYTRILTQEYDAQFQPLVEKLAGSINSALGQIFIALDNNLSVADNLATLTKTLTFSTNSSGVLTTPSSIVLPTSRASSQVIGLLPIRVQGAGDVVPTSGVTLTWKQVSATSGNQIQITNATGLPSGVSFTVTVLVLF